MLLTILFFLENNDKNKKFNSENVEFKMRFN